MRRAQAALGGAGDAVGWRPRCRLRWVLAETALLHGDPLGAARAAREALVGAEAAAAPRHVAKSLLFLGVAEATAGRDAAAGTLERAATLAASLGALPLVWPARAVLGALRAEREPAAGARDLAEARRTVHTLAAGLPPVLRADWLARPDMAALLAS